jgi:hypothetical protein
MPNASGRPMACRTSQDVCDAGSAAGPGAPRGVPMSAPDDFKVMIVSADGEAVVYLVGGA